MSRASVQTCSSNGYATELRSCCRAGLPLLNSPCSLSGHKATLEEDVGPGLRSFVEVKMAILGSLFQIVLMVSVDIKQHWAWISHTIPISMFLTQLYFFSLCQWQIARSVFLTENRHAALNLTLQLTWSNSWVGRNDNLFVNFGWLP